MTSKENNYSFSHSPCLSPFKFSLRDHLLTRNGINILMMVINGQCYTLLKLCCPLVMISA
ncbi:hypothetical protein L2703_03135 [Shewanella basaltis]|nr:hypothetical protein [Shewanella basaltis]MCL1112605.1 hypothetical protein [Shewanella basaltis]